MKAKKTAPQQLTAGKAKKSLQYDHLKIEKKWQKEWETKGMYKASDSSKAKKFYPLVEFPFPSGAGLHTGHIRSYTAMDIVARKRRMEGQNVLFPIGWDAFGLPTENYAIKTGIQPQEATRKNTDTFRKQLKLLGLSFDWSREVNTTDPEYYKWTQWFFLQFYKHNLAYKARITINWCPKDKIGLANEEVVNGCCERCGTPVEKREKEQWLLAITKYADRLEKDLDSLNYLDKIKLQQKNWIGKSTGSEIIFKLSTGDSVPIFTTRADTIYGATYLVLAPEHSLIQSIHNKIHNWQLVEKYQRQVSQQEEIERTAEGKEKTGIELKGITATNPATGEQIPVWIADYVLASYGTGAVMAVPAHDERDFAFAKRYNLPIKHVIIPTVTDESNPPQKGKPEKITNSEIPFLIESMKTEAAYTSPGILFDSGTFTGQPSEKAKKEITKFVKGKIVTKYKLRDWIFSRQRYWGEPIPMISCEKCGWVPVPEKELPVLLPKVKKYEPTDSGESPLASIKSWVDVKCPSCKGKAKRETDTMPNWAGSSWYFLRYVDPKNKKAFADPKKLKNWLPVDWYNGGMEHTTLHLLYSRFWYKFLFDIGLVPNNEPYIKRTSHGMILAPSGEKMSKSKGNVVNPDDLVKLYGADTLRLFEMFIGPFDQAVFWNSDAMIGPRRFIERVWKLVKKVEAKKKSPPTVLSTLHKTIQKVSNDIETMQFNTAISQLMICLNEFEKNEYIGVNEFKQFLQLIGPFAPHISEELWEKIGEKKSIHLSSWPEYKSKLVIDDEVTIGIQINGKVRAEITLSKESNKEEIEEKVLSMPRIKELLEGQKIKKIIIIPGRIVNIVI